MANFFFYELESGAVVQTGHAPVHDIPLQIPPDGCGIAMGDAEIGKHKYIAGVLVECANTIDPNAVLERWRNTVEVSRFQACAALYQAGYLDDVEDYMLTADSIEKMAWQMAQVFKRNSFTVLKLQSVLGLSDVELDDLFRFALTIQA